jgi:uncharacterized protein (DUF2141 family)
MNRRLAAVLFCLSVSTAAADTFADEAGAPPPPRITVDVSALRNAKGVVRCSLFASADGFPTNPARALMSVNAPSIANGHATCTFDNVKPGTYAVGFLHDENGNGKMDTNFLGMPSEGYGASNNARGSMGPPKFEDAKFNHEGQTTLHLKTEY